MPDNSTGAWDVIVTPWHLDEHVPELPVPVGAVATIGPPLPDGAVPSRVTVLQRAVRGRGGGGGPAAAAVRGLPSRAWPWPPGSSRGMARSPWCGWMRTAISTLRPSRSPATSAGWRWLMLTGRAPGLFADPLGLRPVPEHNIVLADARVPARSRRTRRPRGITASADVVATILRLRAAWLPGQVGGPSAREAIAQLASALGARLTWPPEDARA